MPRTDSTTVQAVLLPGKNYNGTSDLTRFIAVASAVVDRVEACAVAKGKPQDASVLTEMETWLAAHYYTRSDPTYASKSTGGASSSFHGQTGKGLEASFFGQAALDLDFSGCLAAVTKKQRVGMGWLGKPEAQQIDYVDRN